MSQAGGLLWLEKPSERIARAFREYFFTLKLILERRPIADEQIVTTVEV
jgi:hypothetical protein